jgi:hypothetical protein
MFEVACTGSAKVFDSGWDLYKSFNTVAVKRKRKDSNNTQSFQIEKKRP